MVLMDVTCHICKVWRPGGPIFSLCLLSGATWHCAGLAAASSLGHVYSSHLVHLRSNLCSLTCTTWHCAGLAVASSFGHVYSFRLIHLWHA